MKEGPTRGGPGKPDEPGAGRQSAPWLAFSPGRLQYVTQFAVQTQPVGPVPQVGEIEVEAGVFHDADHVVKISWSSSPEFHKDEVFRRTHPSRQSMKCDGLAPIERGALKSGLGKDQVNGEMGARLVCESEDDLTSHRVSAMPGLVHSKSCGLQQAEKRLRIVALSEDEEINIIGRSRNAPAAEGQGPDDAIPGLRGRQRPLGQFDHCQVLVADRIGLGHEGTGHTRVD